MAIIQTITGNIYDQFNSPMPNHIVQVFDKDIRTEQLLGTLETDIDGKFSLEYPLDKFSRAKKNSADIFIKVFVNKSLQKKLGESSIYFNVPKKFTLDFKIDGKTYISLSEFDKLINIIQPLLEGQKVAILDLKEDDKHQDISYLSAKIEIDKSIISLLPIAFQHNVVTKNTIPAAIFYGLFRLQFPTKLNKLLLIKSESLRAGMEEAIKSNIISSKWKNKIAEFVKKLNELSTEFILSGNDEKIIAFKKMLGTVLPSKKQQKIFIDTYFTNEEEPEKFWENLSLQQGFTNNKTIEATKRLLHLHSLTAGQPELAAHLYKIQQTDTDFKELSSFAMLSKEVWKKQIVEAKVQDFPNGIKGETDAEKREDYAIFLEKRLNGLFPPDASDHHVIQNLDDSFNGFKSLVKNPDFDLKTTKVEGLFEAFDFNKIRDKEDVKNILKKKTNK